MIEHMGASYLRLSQTDKTHDPTDLLRRCAVDKPIIVARNIHKTFRNGKIEVQALRGVDLSIGAGEMVAVMGPSGCGKTTLINCLSGLDSFDSGEVEIEGASLRAMSDRARTSYRARRMGFVFQTFNLLPVITAVENVELPLLLSRVRPREARQRACRGLTQVGLARSRGASPGRALRRRAPTRHHRARAGQPARDHLGRRADGQPGHQGGRGCAHAHARPEPGTGPDLRDRHPRPQYRGAVRPRHSHAGRRDRGRRAR